NFCIFPFDGGAGDAEFGTVRGMTMGSDGLLYVSDTESIRQVAFDPLDVITYAGGFVSGSADGVGTLAEFFEPRDLAAGIGEIYVADTGNNAIRHIDLGTAEVMTESLVAPISQPQSVEVIGSTLLVNEIGAPVIYAADRTQSPLDLQI